jgi:hypothetical protein
MHAAADRDKNIETLLCEALCRGSHARRLAGFEHAHRQALEEDLDHWALLCKGFSNWVRERYNAVNAALERELSSLSQGRDCSAPESSYCDLCRLLFAHVNRRLADDLPGKASRLGIHFQAFHQQISYLLDRASDAYSDLLASKSPHIRAVSAYSLGNIELIRPWADVDAARGECLTRASRMSALRNAERRYSKVTRTADRAELEIAYAPPHNRLAWLEWIRSEAQETSTYELRREQCLLHLARAIAHADKAIHISRSEEGADGRLTYAPPLLTMARALFWRAVYQEECVPRDDILCLLNQAIECAPYDAATQRDVEAFASEVRAATQRNVEAFASEDRGSKRLCKEAAFSRKVRLAYPIGATRRDLDQYFDEPQEGNSASARDELLVLRRWSSYSPLLSGEGHETVGGGYLFHWQDHCVAVDPGVGFIRNLHGRRFRAYDIDTVVMTHQHVDHCADFEPLLSLFKRHASLHKDSGQKKQVTVLYTLSGRERWQNSLLHKLYLDEQGRLLTPPGGVSAAGCPTPIADSQITVQPTPLYGHRDAGDEAAGDRKPTGVGVVFQLRKEKDRDWLRTVGFTSDTGYMDAGGEPVSGYFQGCDIVVVHVSTIADLEGRMKEEDMVMLVLSPY